VEDPVQKKKVCMLGSFSVGKTSLVRRFVDSIFSDKYLTTIGVKVEKKVVKVDGKDVTLVIWDIHGEDVYQKINMSNLRGMSGYLLVADGTRRQTLDDALALNERIIQEIGKVPSVLLLNKCDLTDQWEIDSSQASKLAAAGWNVFNTSAKSGEGVEEAFLRLARAALSA
jgi:small GTP-binding protein